MRLVGRAEVIDEPWFGSGAGRAAHRAEVDPPVAAWIGAHSLAETLDAFERAEAAIGPVYDVRGILADPQYLALETAVTVPDPELGPLRMQNLMFRLSGSPGEIRWAGRPHGADTDAVFGELGLDPARIAALREQGAA
jgi:crotonobetainyl-CoA:carnitine CoA-transferase CaiB-like acyl-CoA transferase